MPSTRPPLRRLLWTFGQLRSGSRLKATDVAEHFGVAVRTAYRDLDFLRDQCDAPLEYDHREQTYLLTEPTYSLPLVPLTTGELFALLFAEKVVHQYHGTPYEKDLESAFRKIEEFLPEEVSVEPKLLEDILSLDLGPVAVPEADTFRTVVDALMTRHRLVIRYTSFSGGRTSDRTVDAYRIYCMKGSWYLAAHDHRRRTVRDFALARIRRAVRLEERYEIPPDFRFEDYMRDSFGIEKGGRPVTVAIRFSPRQAPWIRERRWHATQRIQERLDGGCVLRLRVAGMGEVKRWVMQFGVQAEVLAPKRLRNQVTDELRATLDRYHRSAKPRPRH